MLATHEQGLRVAPFSYRPTSGEAWERGWELGGTMSVTSVQRPFFLTSFQSTTLRVLDSRSYSLSLLQSGALVGLRIGPVEPEAGIALSTINLDIFHKDFSFGMFSPRAAAGVGLRFGEVRLSVHAYSEYLWRWLGTDYYTRGVALTVRVQRPPPTPATEPSLPRRGLPPRASSRR